jgi:hypothetical protein
MARSRFVRLFSVGSVLLASAVIGSAAYGASQSAVTSSNTDAFRTTPMVIDLSADGGVKTTILSVSLPAGSWVISFDAVALSNFGKGQYIRCALYQGSTQLDKATVSLTDSVINGAFSISVMGTATAMGSFTAKVKCWQDASIAPPYFNHIDIGAALWAHRSSSLSV